MPLCFTSNFSAAQLGHKARTWCMEIWSFKVVMELMISEILLISDNAKKNAIPLFLTGMPFLIYAFVLYSHFISSTTRA